MPKYQGELDGLCGIYAIINAFEYLGIEHDDLFEDICQVFTAKRWPNLLWEGTYFGDLKRAIADCKKIYTELDSVKISYPFWKKVPKNNEDYWKCFHKLFDNAQPESCALIGMTKPSYHWIVAKKEKGKKKIHFIDSDPRKPNVVKKESSLHAGEKHKTKQWIICRNELIFFEKL